MLRAHPAVEDDTCLERMRVTLELDGLDLWSLRSDCIVHAKTLDTAYACNHVGHPDWPLPHSSMSVPQRQDPGTFIPVRVGSTCLCFAAAIALAAWARRVGDRYPSPRFVGRLAYAFLTIPLVDAVLALRTLTSPRSWPPGEWIVRLLGDIAPAATMLAIGALVMFALARRYTPRGREDRSAHPYRRA